MPKHKDFKIEKCIDCIRITRQDVSGDYHTHVHSKAMADKIVNNVCSGKIPRSLHSNTLISMYRLSNDEKYRAKIEELLETRRRKGRKLPYENKNLYH